MKSIIEQIDDLEKRIQRLEEDMRTVKMRLRGGEARSGRDA